MSITEVPIWVNISFGILFLTVPSFLLAHFFTREYAQVDKSKARRLRIGIMSFVTAFLVLIGILSLMGVYAKNVLPPRILLLGALPLLFCYVFAFRFRSVREAFQAASLKSLVAIHIFRFVGVYFFLVYAFGALPKQFAFIGGGGDVLTAILAFPVIYALKRNWKHAWKAVFLWNIIGLLDIFSVLTNAIYLTQRAIEGQGDGVLEFATFPFSWIPAFAPVTIIFLHVLIFMKMIHVRNSGKM